MRIVTGSTMAELDRAAIQDRGIPGLELMERAGRGVAEAILRRYPSVSAPLIVCGQGNNGGDGFVIARYLLEAGRSPSVVMLAGRDDLSEDARANLDRFETECGAGPRKHIPGSGGDFAAAVAGPVDLVVDAVFGTGLRGRVRDPYVPIIEHLNGLNVPRVAVDIASGVVADDGSVEGVAFRADLTVTMALPKVGHFLPPGIDHTGRVEVVDIGIPADVVEEKGAHEAEMLTAAEVAALLPRYGRSAHKGDRGRLLVLAGSPGLTGAGCLAGEAALYAGAGLVTVGVPEPLNPVFEAKLTEAMTLPLPATLGHGLSGEGLEAVMEFSERADAVVFGPGVGKDEGTGKLLFGLLDRLEKPVLIDADGLTLLAGDLSRLKGRPGPTILTPHPGEMARLVGGSSENVQKDRWGKARRFVKEWDVTLVRKGAGTVMAGSEHLWVNPTGGPAMSQGGMGDVLSGVIGALLARGLGAENAARAGVYLHGLAGDLVAEETGDTVVLASEVGRAVRRAEARTREDKPSPGDGERSERT